MIKEFIRNHQLLVCYIIIIDLILIASTIVYLSTDRQQENLTPSQPIPTISLTPGKDYVPGHVTVKFKSVPREEIDEALAELNARIIDYNPSIGSALLQVPTGQEAVVLQGLKQRGIVEYAELDVIRSDHAFQTNDPNFNQQYGLTKIKIPEAWDVTRGKGVLIANLQDGGADTTHPDLVPNIAGGDGSSLHGTHTSGIIAAAGNNGVGVTGTCPECKVLVKNLPGYTATNIARGITEAADAGAKVISMSFGGSVFTQQEQDAVNYAWGKGAAIVASAGNNGSSSKGYPAAYDNVLSVGATDANDQKPNFSNFGTWVKIAAPGDKILSTIPNNQYGLSSGTSMSAPMITGVLGLIWSTSYGTSNDAVVKRICDTADKIPGTGQNMTCGRVNALAAVQGATAGGTQPSAGSPSPSFFPLAPCQNCTNQTATTPTLPVKLSTTPLQPSMAPGTSLTSKGVGHNGDNKGLITTVLTLLLLLLKLMSGSFGE